MTPPLNRRGLLLGAAALTVFSMKAARAAVSAPLSNATVDDATMRHFMAVSGRLTGFTDLNAELGHRLITAFIQIVPNFRETLALLPATAEESAPTSAFEQTVMTGWYEGVVQHEDNMACVAYVTALEHVLTADVLKPPSYAYGAYGSWQAKPLPAAHWATQDLTP